MVTWTILILHSRMASCKYITFMLLKTHVFFPSMFKLYNSLCYFCCINRYIISCYMENISFWSVSWHHLPDRITHIFMLLIHESKVHCCLSQCGLLIRVLHCGIVCAPTLPMVIQISVLRTDLSFKGDTWVPVQDAIYLPKNFSAGITYRSCYREINCLLVLKTIK